MFEITPPVADTIHKWANVLLVLGSVSALVGTIGIFWSGGMRDTFANQRVSANEAETAKAKAEAAKANAEAANANVETARARLEQERLKSQMAWRRVSDEQAQHLVAALSGHSLETWLTFVGNDPESVVFREDLDKVLTAAGVKTKFFSGYAMAVGLKILGGTAEQRALFLKAFLGRGSTLA